MRAPRSMILLAGVAAAALGGAIAWAQLPPGPPPPPADFAQKCAALAGTNVAGGTVKAAEAKTVDMRAGTPILCEVTATLSSGPGSSIGVVVRLPQDWNRKLLGIGGGGWAGNVTLQAASEGLVGGYATAQTDGGHPTTEPWDAKWTKRPDGQPNWVALKDFSSRAQHMTAAAAKEIVRAFYGTGQARAYFQGCSTGGRMALIEAQRFPDDYDGIIAGAPVYSLRTQTTGLVRALLGKQGNFSPAQLAAISAASLAACDKDDGLADGIIADPMQCKWDPAPLQCAPGASAGGCLTPQQVGIVRKVYAGTRANGGAFSAYPAPHGSEPQWAAPFFFGSADGSGGALTDLSAGMFGDAKFNLAAFDPDKHQAALESGRFSKMYEAKDPNIAKFLGRGGKLILWHGSYDPGPAPMQTLGYYQAVRKATGAQSDSAVRLFFAPGVGHCVGGPGPDRMDLIGALDAWVEANAAPQRITASKASRPMTRPLCPYPQQARYSGKGNPNDAANFSCG